MRTPASAEHTVTEPQSLTAQRAARKAPRGGLSRTYLRLELVRNLRNPWTIGFAVLMPAALYLLFGAAPAYGTHALAHGTVAGMIMATMALFGAMMAAVNVAGAVADERGIGWHRQLRLTPLRPGAYVGAKLLAALALTFLVVAVTFTVGALSGARLDPALWVRSFVVAWLVGTALFAAFGLAVGYLFSGEAVLGVVGPFMSLFAFFGGLFIPLQQLGPVMQTVGAWTPMYGVRLLVEAPIVGEPVPAAAIANALVWFALFCAVALWRFRAAAGRA